MSRNIYQTEPAARLYHSMLQSRLAGEPLGPHSVERENVLKSCSNAGELLVAIKEARMKNPADTGNQIALAYQFLFLDEAVALKSRLFEEGYPGRLERFDLALARVQAKYGLRITDDESRFMPNLESDFLRGEIKSQGEYRKKSTISLFEKLHLLGDEGYMKKSSKFTPEYVYKAKELSDGLCEGRLDEDQFDLGFWTAVLEDYHGFIFLIPDLGSRQELYGLIMKRSDDMKRCVVESSAWKSRRRYHRRLIFQGYSPKSQEDLSNKLPFELLIERKSDHQIGLALAYCSHKGFPLPVAEYQLRRKLMKQMAETTDVQQLRNLLVEETHKHYKNQKN